MKSWRVTISLIIALAGVLSGCGGGTYGTGGSAPMYARVVDESGAPLVGVVALGVAIETPPASDDSGILILPANESFRIAPVSFILPTGVQVVGYVSTDVRTTRDDALLIELRSDRNGSVSSSVNGETLGCEVLRDSWYSALKDPNLGLPVEERAKLFYILERSEGGCQDVVKKLEERVFSPMGGK